MFKTVSTDCNLDCDYCYYRQSLEGTRVRRRMEQPVLDAFMSQYMQYIADVRAANIAWQGGEPTLAGIDFFERVVELEAKHAPRGTTIANSLQTNATLLDDRWGELLREYNFLVGVSLDGPEDVHDSVRRDRGGHGSFRRVLAGIDVLRKHGVEFNILSVVGPHSVKRVPDVMSFFRSEGFTHVQFIPAMSFQSIDAATPATYMITPEEYGDFLIALFDEWYEHGFPTLSVRTFDAILQRYLGMHSDLCVYGEQCDSGIVVEYNGDVYPCDFYVHPDWRLGNVMDDPLASILAKPEHPAFSARKRTLPAQCQSCEWRPVCNGGCPRNRTNAEGAPPEYFCESHQRFLRYADDRLRSLSERLARRIRTARATYAAPGRKPPERNEPCLCGSARKYKACCGDSRAEQSYLF